MVRAPILQHLTSGTLVFALILAMGTIVGCQRRAPGPWECEQHALRVAKSVGLDAPQAKQSYQSEISRCLTKPYDRELVRCVEERGPSRRCYQEFERRVSDPESPELPRG
jgi:hypothetical protein